MNTRPLSVPATLVLVLLNALLWFGFGLVVAAGAHPALPDSRLIREGLAVLALAAGASFVVLFIRLRRRNPVGYFLTLALLAIISFFTVTDEFGWADLVVLGLNVVSLVLLVKDRGWYLQTRASAAVD